MKLRTLWPLWALFSAAAVAGEVDFKPGLWSWESRTEMPGMPMQMPAQTFETCITGQEMMPQSAPLHPGCEVLESSMSGNVGRWRIHCDTPQGASEMSGWMRYTGDRAEGESQVSTQGMTMNSKMSGRRLGDCR